MFYRGKGKACAYNNLFSEKIKSGKGSKTAVGHFRSIAEPIIDSQHATGQGTWSLCSAVYITI